ncbi:Acetoacetyl-CoA synthetase [Psilocybe cubensis]|uniref:Acetoacetyl-CoA synthetase n=2 Tax=Psilocybe cubensis TaxID=181762 RepID=A0ACB8H3V9_PSICU|nr:Acetoacetyl-CoA synthetase [Psilocybe cubensis]KAH9482673.1 Acetoacetyl-CoA synthetase [Psilocybe cubensis]
MSALLTVQHHARPLFLPQDPVSSPVFRFLQRVNSAHALALASYFDLYIWSTARLDAFWDLVWDETNIIGVKGSHVVDNTALPSANPLWFKDARVNWAENMLHCRSELRIALIEAIEPTPDLPNPRLRQLSYAQLYSLVADAVSALLFYGVKPGDRVASYSSNCIENVVACLATSAIGAIWVSAAADFGPEGVKERFEQVQPKFIFAVDAVVYNHKVHPHLPKLSRLLSGLADLISPPKIVIINTFSHDQTSQSWGEDWIAWEDFLSKGHQSNLGRTETGEIKWNRLPFDAPLWILFSSGTTGRPKPIVHRAGGMLLQAKKEFAICGDLRPDDVFFYYTTTGWMMWNFLVSGLSIGCTLVLYDGSPLRDPSLLWKLVDDLGITIFGTSAKYLDQLSKGYRPREHHDLSTLRHIYSTGSPLAPPLYDYVYEHIHPKVLLGSITGGTDICSLFAGMCSALPVYRGEIQCRMLGMAVESFSAAGTLNPPDEPGELVCVKPFPCMPLGFWPLPGYGTEADVEAALKRFHQSYFSEFEGVWYHGDHILITASKSGNGGGIIMLGRSDGVLNPGGIRFGSSEIYEVLDLCFSHPTAEFMVVDYLAVGQKTEGGADERVILFVKLPPGQKITPEFERKVKAEIRARRSPRHVPARIIQVSDVPYTLNGKRVEVLVKKIINGAPLSSVNPATLSNPECLEFYHNIGQELRQECP